MITKRPYSPEEEATLRDLWLAGVSATYIGHRLSGRTKDSIIGKAHRMGLPPHKKAEPEPVSFEDIDTIPLPRPQREALALLLDEHPRGVTAKEIGRRLFPDSDMSRFVVDRYTSARIVIKGLGKALSPYGWTCGCLGDRGGVKLYPVKERQHESIPGEGAAA